VANFVTFEDKLGHTCPAAAVLRGIDDQLACEISVLAKLLTKELLALKMQIS
jgi:hypothetical protein